MERLKYDNNKPRFDLIDPHFELDLAKILEHGAAKYKAGSWKYVEIEAYISALRRHLNAYMRGEYIDSDSGMPHTACMGANVMFIHYLARMLFEGNIKVNPNNIECDDYDPDLRRNANTCYSNNPVTRKCSEDGLRCDTKSECAGDFVQTSDDQPIGKIFVGRRAH
jgi:hypothetical protein